MPYSLFPVNQCDTSQYCSSMLKYAEWKDGLHFLFKYNVLYWNLTCLAFQSPGLISLEGAHVHPCPLGSGQRAELAVSRNTTEMVVSICIWGSSLLHILLKPKLFSCHTKTRREVMLLNLLPYTTRLWLKWPPSFTKGTRDRLHNSTVFSIHQTNHTWGGKQPQVWK